MCLKGFLYFLGLEIRWKCKENFETAPDNSFIGADVFWNYRFRKQLELKKKKIPR